ncbi:MAG: ATP-binding protein [Proteobacteria bacterium]|nr:ATP-binding protein [Pseudomonadota bacterium]
MGESKRGTIEDSEDERSRGRALDQLCRFANVMGTSLDSRTLVEDAIDPLLSLSGADRLLIALADENDRYLVPIARHELDLPPHAKPLPINAIASLGTEAATFPNGDGLPEPLAGMLGEIRDPLALVPLWAHGRLRGVAVAIRSGEPFPPLSMKLMTVACRQFALAVENSRLLSEMRQSYAVLMDTQEEMIRAEKLAAMGQLAATMAHEIRNPLATIFSAISQIRKHSQANETSATLLNIAEEEATRLNTIVSGLLDFARPRKPMFERRRPLEIVREVARAVLDDDKTPGGLEITVDPASDDPVAALDPELVQRALARLVDNAIAAIEGSGRIVLRVRNGDSRGTAAIFEVQDDGGGIPREALAKVMEPFFSTRPSGIGLGLPTVRRIAEDHGGSLEISSEVGRGTVVRLLIGSRQRNAETEGSAK